MNLLALQCFFSLIFIVIVGVAVFNRNSKEQLNRLFSLVCVVESIWIFGEFGLALSQTFEEARIWGWLHAGWPLGIAFSAHFVLLFTENHRLIKPLWKLSFIYGPALVFCVLELTTSLLYTAPIRDNLVWVLGKPIIRPVTIVALVWLIAVLMSQAFLVVRYAFTVSDIQRRNQARALLLGLLISTVIISLDAKMAISSIKNDTSNIPLALAIAHR